MLQLFTNSWSIKTDNVRFQPQYSENQKCRYHIITIIFSSWSILKFPRHVERFTGLHNPSSTSDEKLRYYMNKSPLAFIGSHNSCCLFSNQDLIKFFISIIRQTVHVFFVKNRVVKIHCDRHTVCRNCYDHLTFMQQWKEWNTIPVDHLHPCPLPQLLPRP